jgi:FkbM family methyltransferase
MKINEEIKSKLVLTQFDDFKIYTIQNDCMGRDIINKHIWEPHIVNFLKTNLKKDSVFLDVGSNYGWHSIIASNICDKVFSFEPQTLMYEIQKLNIEENKIENCFVFKYALGNSEDTKEMAPIDYGMNGVNIGDLSIGNGGELVNVKTLDSMKLSKVDVIKIDVQGYEKFVLEGGMETIKKNKPIMIIEFEEFQLNKFWYGSKNLFDIIRELDYEIYFLEYVYPSDHICVHKDSVDIFESFNNISPLDYSNDLNMNLENGVTKKLVFN